MGELKLKIGDKLEKRFRIIAMQRYEYQKGALSNAANKAIEAWTEQYEDLPEETTENPIDLLVGIMKPAKNKTSVQLQHEAWKSIGERHAHRR